MGQPDAKSQGARPLRVALPGMTGGMNQRPPHSTPCPQSRRNCRLQVTPESLSFGKVAAQHAVADKEFTLNNLSPSRPIKIKQITLTGRDAKYFRIIEIKTPKDAKNVRIKDPSQLRISLPARETMQLRVRLTSTYSEKERGALRAQIRISADCGGSNCNHMVTLSADVIEVQETLGFELESGALVWEEQALQAGSEVARTSIWKISVDTYTDPNDKSTYADLEIKPLEPFKTTDAEHPRLESALREYLQINASWYRNANWPPGKITQRVNMAQCGNHPLDLRPIPGVSSYSEVRDGHALLISPQATFSIDVNKVYRLFRSNFPFTGVPQQTGAFKKIFKRYRERGRFSEQDEKQFHDHRSKLMQIHEDMKAQGESGKWGAFKDSDLVKGFFTYFSYYTTGLVPFELAPKSNYGLFLRSPWSEYAEFVASEILERSEGLDEEGAKAKLGAIANNWWAGCKGKYGSGKQGEGCTVLELFTAVLNGSRDLVGEMVEENVGGKVPIKFASDEDLVVNRIHIEIRSLRNYTEPRSDGGMKKRSLANHSVVGSVLICYWIFKWLQQFSRRHERDEANKILVKGFSGEAGRWEKEYSAIYKTNANPQWVI